MEEEKKTTESQEEKAKGGCSKIIIVVLIILAVIYGINIMISNLLKEDVTEYLLEQKNIENSTNFMNNSLPMQIDEGIVIYKIEYIRNGNIQKWHAQLTEVEKDELDSNAMSMYQKDFKDIQISTLKNNPNNKSFVSVGVTFLYLFEDKNGDEIFEVKITPDEYK